MQTKQQKRFIWQISGGVLALSFGFVLLCVLNWASSVELLQNLALGLAGISLCLTGIRLTLIATEDDGLPDEVNGTELGRIHFNGYYLIAYESETADGSKQFRLASLRSLTPEREAALIRYLALEGFLASLWPEVKGRIEEEARWAFLV